MALPLLLAFTGGAIAVFWPWLQTHFRGRKFHKLIKRELEEIGPHPKSPEKGKPWWEHATKRFVHEEVFARDRISENREFLLSLHPAVVYRVSQLWIALEKRNSEQWLEFLRQLSEDRRVRSEPLKAALRDWQLIVDKQPPELRVLPRVRDEPSYERPPALADARLDAYRALLPLTDVGRPGKITALSPRERRKREDALTAWYYGGGGLLLSEHAHRAFLAARSRLEDPHAKDEHIRCAMSTLRTELKIDLGVRHADERDVPTV